MARNFNGSNQDGMPGLPLSAYPLTLACWGRAANATSYTPLITLWHNASSHFFARVGFRGDVGGDPVEAVTSDAGGAAAANSAGSFTANTWTHVAGVFASGSSRVVYLDGASTSNSTSRSPNTPDTLRIASAAGSFAAADLAEVGIWNVALEDDEIAALARGISPLLIRPTALVAYWPLGRDSPEPDWHPASAGSTRYDLTLNNSPASANHAPVALFLPVGLGATIAAETDATVTADVVTATASLPAPTVTGGATLTADVVTATASLPAPTVTGGATLTADAVTATASLPAPTVTGSATVTADVLTLTGSLPAPAVSGAAAVAADALTATVSLPAPATTGGASTDADTVTASASLPLPGISGGAGIQADVLQVTASLPTPAVSGDGSASVAADVLTVTASTPAPTVTGTGTPEPAPSGGGGIYPAPPRRVRVDAQAAVDVLRCYAQARQPVVQAGAAVGAEPLIVGFGLSAVTVSGAAEVGARRFRVDWALERRFADLDRRFSRLEDYHGQLESRIDKRIRARLEQITEERGTP